MAGSMVYRLRVDDVGATHMGLFVDAMRSLQARLDNKGFNYIAGFHGAPGWYCWHHQFSPRTPVQARLFLPWHRAYLWWLEQALQDTVAEGADLPALPWWDWANERGIPTSYDQDTVGGSPNPLKSFHMEVPATVNNAAMSRDTTRSPGDPDWIGTQDQMDHLLEETDWSSFSDRLQNYHDSVHGYCGGDMASQTTAGYDPIFFAHHCNIDRMWWQWQQKHGDGGIPQSLLDLPLTPFGKTFRQVLSTQALGYEYATTATVLPNPTEVTHD